MAEIEQVALEVIKEVDSKIQVTICGSYRRQKATCGDIDMLITHPDFTSDKPAPEYLKLVVEKLKERKILTEDYLSFGHAQYHGVAVLPKKGAIHRYQYLFKCNSVFIQVQFYSNFNQKLLISRVE